MKPQNDTINLKEREQLSLAFDGNIISEEVFLLFICDINRSANLDYSHWHCSLLDLQNFVDAECCTEFRLKKNDIRLKHVLQNPDEIICYNSNDIKVDGTDALCTILRCLDYQTRYSDLIPRFGRPVPQLCIIFYPKTRPYV